MTVARVAMERQTKGRNVQYDFTGGFSQRRACSTG